MPKNKSSNKTHVRLEMAHKGEAAAMELAKKLGMETQARKWMRAWRSIKGEVRLAFDRAGKDAALAVAAKHGIGAERLDQWLAKWGVGLGEGVALINSTRRRVCFVFNREQTGTLVKEGPEQSEIRLDETGEHRFYPNTWIAAVETETKTGKRKRAS